VAERPVYSSIRLPAWVELLLLVLNLGSFLRRALAIRHILLIRDEGEYAYTGQQILRGAIPYLDYFNQKTPFTFYFAGRVPVAGRPRNWLVCGLPPALTAC